MGTAEFERVTVSGDELATRVHEIISHGSVRRVSIQNERHCTVLEILFLLGVGPQAFRPVYGALRSLSYALSRCTVLVERDTAWPLRPT